MEEKGKWEKMKNLIREAKQLLSDDNGIWSDADRRALEDMVRRAEQALDGTSVPFTRNREFVKSEKHKEVSFAYDRFTMVPSFLEKGKVYGHYGLKEAVCWFREQDMSRWSADRLCRRKQELMERGRQLLSVASYGMQVGDYDACQGKQLRACLEKLENCEKEHLAECLAQSIDAFHGMRCSQILYSEQNPAPVFLLPQDKMREIRQGIGQKMLLTREYGEIRKRAQETTLEKSRMLYEQIWEKHTCEEMDAHFDIWGDTGRVVNMTVPEGTKSGRICFRLPSEENEQDGLGHIRIWDVKIFSADGPEIEIPDASFYLCNPDPATEDTAVCKDTAALKENSVYTLYFKAKQDGKFKKGLHAVMQFLDEDEKILGEFVHIFNRKSVPAMQPVALNMQCNAIVYAVEGDRDCAQKAKYELLAFLNDFCQGAEHWMIYNSRPEGCDAYGAVQAGRIMCSAASTYSLIRNADVFTEEEKKFFYGLVDYLLQYCMDKRDRITMSYERVQQGSSNWQTDMCIGTAALMMVLPDFPDRKVWMYNAEALLEAQLAVNLNRDGSWPESIRYHHAALNHFASFAAAWKLETGEDWLVATRLKDMFAYTIHTITPAYEYFGGRIGTPPFGDHRLGGGEEFSIYGLWADRMAQAYRELADQMYQVWEKAHYPVQGLSGEALAIENLMYTEPETCRIWSQKELNPESAVSYPDSGLYVFRHRNETGNENYLAVMSSPSRIGHGHLDQGSFVLYYQNYPVVMDSGVEGYFDASVQWHLSSYSHGCMQFAASKEDRECRKEDQDQINLDAGNYSLDRGWLDVPYTSEVLEVTADEKEERMTLQIEHPQGRKKGLHTRTFVFDKRTGMLTIKDKIENYSGKVLFSLPLVMKSADLAGQTVHAQGWYPVKADIEFVSPAEKIFLERGRTTPMFPCEEEPPMLLYVRAEMDASRETEVRIRPAVL